MIFGSNGLIFHFMLSDPPYPDLPQGQCDFNFPDILKCCEVLMGTVFTSAVALLGFRNLIIVFRIHSGKEFQTFQPLNYRSGGEEVSTSSGPQRTSSEKSIRQRKNVINLKMTNSRNKVKAYSHLHLLLLFFKVLSEATDEGGIPIKNAFTLSGLFSILIMFRSHPSILQSSFIYSGGFVCSAAISIALNIARFVLSAAQTHCSTTHPCVLSVALLLALVHNQICLQRAGMATGVGEEKTENQGRTRGRGRKKQLPKKLKDKAWKGTARKQKKGFALGLLWCWWVWAGQLVCKNQGLLVSGKYNIHIWCKYSEILKLS